LIAGGFAALARWMLFLLGVIEDDRVDEKTC
jgi:hypothetical protein